MEYYKIIEKANTRSSLVEHILFNNYDYLLLNYNIKKDLSEAFLIKKRNNLIKAIKDLEGIAEFLDFEDFVDIDIYRLGSD